MEINIEKLSTLDLKELSELKDIVLNTVNDLSNNLTDYAMISNDIDFKNMDEFRKKEYSMLIAHQNLLSKIKEIITTKIIKEYIINYNEENI